MMVQGSIDTLGTRVIGLVTSVLFPNLIVSAVTMVARGLHLTGLRGLGNSIDRVSHLEQQRC